MNRHNDLKRRIYAYECARCRALVSLVDELGAVLHFPATRGGRLCEFAVVAGTGPLGIVEQDIVRARREYADHLGIQLFGRTSNSDVPNHIEWACKNSNHNPLAKNRVNLGRAKARKGNGKYYLT